MTKATVETIPYYDDNHKVCDVTVLEPGDQRKCNHFFRCRADYPGGGWKSVCVKCGISSRERIHGGRT